mmetsp:Transcript_3014/g.7166  ORF Transcript_3014/g.7166 Transcript_3014/m.7166 type:complete len:341 (+) Transcript_3014:2-1024(+)
MWCGFENVVIARKCKEFVMATAQEGTGYTLTSTPAPADFGHKEGRRDIPPEKICLDRSSQFPQNSLLAALHTHLELARASNQDDEKMIIDTVQTELGGFESANSKLRVLGATALFATNCVTTESVQVLNQATEPFELSGAWGCAAEAMKLGLELQNCCGLLVINTGLAFDSDLQALVRGLQPGQQLRKVNLDLMLTNVGDAALQALGETLSKKSVLESVVLNFGDCENIGDAGVKGLGQGLGQAPNLASVELELDNCQKIGDVGAEGLGQGLGQAPSLASVKLNFRGCENIGDDGVTGLGQGLGQAPNLVSVHLIFKRLRVKADTRHEVVQKLIPGIGSA